MAKQTELLQPIITIEYLPYGSDMPYRIVVGNNPVNYVGPLGSSAIGAIKKALRYWDGHIP